MITIDAHQHFWNYDPVKDHWITNEMGVLRSDFTPDQLKPILDSNQIDGCVVVQADQSEDETRFLLTLASDHDFIKGVVGWVDLCAEDIHERLAAYAEFKKLKGFRHIVQSEPDDNFLLRADFMRGISALQSFNVTYDILIYSRQLPAAVEFVKKFPSQKFVIDHLAKPPIKDRSIEVWKKGIQKIANMDNVCCKISGMITEADWQHGTYADFEPYLEVVFNSFGIDRVMYGSDWPVCLLAGPYDKQLSIIKTYIQSLSTTDQHKVMGSNAINFYRL